MAEASTNTGGEDDGFQNYVDDSMDPGYSILIATVIFCVLLIAALPCIVAVGKRFVKHEDAAEETDVSEAQKSKEGSTPSRDNLAQKLRGRQAGDSQEAGGVARHHRYRKESEDEDDNNNSHGDDDDANSAHSAKTGVGSVASALVSAILATSPHGGPIKRRNQLHVMHREAQIGHDEVIHEQLFDDNENHSTASHSVLGRISHDEVSIRDAVDAPEYVYSNNDGIDFMKNDSPTGTCCLDTLLVIADWDYETRRICKLMFPFVMQALLVGITETVRVALIGQFIGTPALSAYVVVTMIVGMTNVFLKGFQDACTTLCSQAVGAGNKRLAGQYIQIATILYAVCYIPVFFLWYFFTGAVFTWLGFDDQTKAIGEQFAILFMFSSFLRGFNASMHALLDVIDKENYSTMFVSGQEVFATLGTLAAALQPGVSNLQLVGLLLIVEEAIALVLNSAIIVWYGWFDKYLDGLVGSFAMLNTKALKTLISTSMALSLGEVIAYGEWELLTVFASVLGPAEVATWGLLGNLWNALELVTEAVANAGEVRTAFLLGSGQPAQAKLSAYKTLYLGIFASVFITSCMFIAGDSIPTWLTSDPTLQRMTAELIPLFGIGNIALSIGTMSWTLVGAQGRYRLSTSVGLSGAWLVAIPMAAILTVVYNVDLQGQTAAIVIGYMVSGTANTYILIQSDWPKLSRRVIAQTAENVGDDDDDDDSSSSSSSSSRESTSGGTESYRNNRTKRGRKPLAKRVVAATSGRNNGFIHMSDSKSLPDIRASNGGEEPKGQAHGGSTQAKKSMASDPCSMADDLSSTLESLRNSVADILNVSTKPSQARRSATK